jgi:hypothetical protein
MDQPQEFKRVRRIFLVTVLALPLCVVIVLAGVANASENGASVYPVGVETVMPGMMPPPHGTMFYEYTASVSANQTDDANGNAIKIPDFKLRVFAVAFKVVHNWGWKFFGGTVESNIAVPFVHQELHIPPGKFTKLAVGNIAVSPLGVRHAKKHWHFFYEGDLWFPGTGRSATDALNIGQNNYAAGPVGGFTYLKGREEVSSKLQYVINLEDTATSYKTGNEFTWEFDGMHGICKQVAVGVNGFLYKQTTDDMLNDLVYNNGNRGRDFGIGPEIRFNLITHGGFAVKYLRDTMVENRAPTNAFWFQLAVPITIGHRE